MADRTSAEIFGNIFEWLAKKPDTPERTEDAKMFWRMSFSYDFSPSQMEASEACLSLGLAKMAVDPRWPEDGEVITYADRDGSLMKGPA